MRKTILEGISGMLLGVACVILGIVIVEGLKSTTAREYSMKGYVVSVLEGERQLIETEDGNIWETIDEDIQVTDEVIITFSDNSTSNITDDRIIKIEKVVD